MYISKVTIDNIRSIKHLEMEFPQGAEAGWHVLLGANGAGKSTIVRAIAAALIGQNEIGFLRIFWDEWLRHGSNEGKVVLAISRAFLKELNLYLHRESSVSASFKGIETGENLRNSLGKTHNGSSFSAAFGPFRRMSGGDSQWTKVFQAAPRAGAHLSVFGEDVALTEALNWLKELDRRRLKSREINQPSLQDETETVFEGTKTFLNESGLLPHNVKMEGIDIDGEPVFLDGQGNHVKVTQLSDGYRSILSLAFELLRQLVLRFGAADTFRNTPVIDLPGVVIIDEIDAHLHPSWQTDIGFWFTKHFPKMQFIVTTHSPLVCRAAENGTIWWLPSPGTQEQFHQITGQDRDRLVYGNILDAYGTEIFGANTSRSKEGLVKMMELADLNIKSVMGDLNAEEEMKRNELQRIFPSGK